MRISDWSSDVCSSDLVVKAAISPCPLLQENGATGDVQRYPAPEVIAAFAKADLWAVAVPQRLGGRGVSATALVRMGADLAKGYRSEERRVGKGCVSPGISRGTPYHQTHNHSSS